MEQGQRGKTGIIKQVTLSTNGFRKQLGCFAQRVVLNNKTTSEVNRIGRLVL